MRARVSASAGASEARGGVGLRGDRTTRRRPVARRASARNEALKRAMPMSRLLANGMEYADAQELYALVDAGADWEEAAARIGERDVECAERALAAGHRQTAHSWLLHASASYRFGQVPLVDSDPRKHELCDRLVGCFRRAGELHRPLFQRVEIPWRHGLLCGWLIVPAQATPWPLVIHLGGVDGWSEEYEPAARYLTARGIASLLIDAPGLGGTRLRHRLHLDDSVGSALSTIVDWTQRLARCSGRIGIWGNSLGAWLAVVAAAQDRRIAACCVNGGSLRPTEIIDRYPRIAGKFEQLTGIDDPREARALVDSLTIAPELLMRMRCSVHFIHGTRDQLVLIENARHLYDLIGSHDKLFSEFPDGDHCLFNRSHGKHSLLADWFAERLADA